MQRFACLLIALAACGGGIKSEEASLTGVNPGVKSCAATAFTDTEGGGQSVLGWTIEFYSAAPGADCSSDDTKIVAKLVIYTNQAALSKPEALLSTGDVTIVPMNPPTVIGNAAAFMSASGVAGVQGIATITEFHLEPDAMHADRIKGTVSAGGKDDNDNDVVVTGSFTAPHCEEK